MAAHSYLSLEQFEARYGEEKPHHEYWFGEALQKPMPSFLHGVLQSVLVLLLSRYGWKSAVEVRLKLSKYAHPIPDLIAFRGQITGAYPTEAFELAIEILSPGDSLTKSFQKAAHYLGWGIGTVWIIDPGIKAAYVYKSGTTNPVELGWADHLAIGPESTFTVGELFTEVGMMMEA